MALTVIQTKIKMKYIYSSALFLFVINLATASAQPGAPYLFVSKRLRAQVSTFFSMLYDTNTDSHPAGLNFDGGISLDLIKLNDLEKQTLSKIGTQFCKNQYLNNAQWRTSKRILNKLKFTINLTRRGQLYAKCIIPKTYLHLTCTSSASSMNLYPIVSVNIYPGLKGADGDATRVCKNMHEKIIIPEPLVGDRAYFLQDNNSVLIQGKYIPYPG